MEIFYLQIESVPSSKSDDYKEVGGAFVSCWVKADTVENAQKKAKLSIEDNSWLVLNVLESYPVSAKTYENRNEALEYFHQAEIDGEVYNFHLWPNEPQESEQIN